MQRIRWDSLRLSNKSFVDEKLRQLHSDLVYTCQIDSKDSYIYILLEQQTKPDHLLPFRVLQYNVAMLAEHLAQSKQGRKHQLLPVIINLCLYTGKETPYPYSVDIYDCFKDPTLGRAMMFKPINLIDLGQIEEAALAQHGTADLLEMLLKRSRERTFFHWMQDYPEAIIKLEERPYGFSGIMYILGVEEEYSAEALIQAMVNIIPEKKEAIMTAAQQLRQEGMQQGIRQGVQQGMQQGMQQGEYNKALHIAKNMLDAHESKEKVCQFTGLSWVEIQQLLHEQESSKK
jgi:predicted transposase/invertase (TIGR01784 family)